MSSHPVDACNVRSGNCCFEIVAAKCDDAAGHFLNGPGIIAGRSQTALAVECGQSFLSMGNNQEPVSSCYEKGIFTSFDLRKSGCWTNTAKELTGLQGVVKFIAFQFAEDGPCSAVDLFYIGQIEHYYATFRPQFRQHLLLEIKRPQVRNRFKVGRDKE